MKEHGGAMPYPNIIGKKATDETTPDSDKPAPSPKSPGAGWMYDVGDVRVVVIDDDPAIGRLVEATLAGNDFSIDVVSDPKMVETVLREQHYHVVILDYVLPGLDSTAVLKLVHETQRSASIIVVT